MSRSDEGYAVMEAFLVALVLMVPLIWGLTAAASLHRSALGSVSAVREAGLAASRAPTGAEASADARSAVARALSERGIDPTRMEIELSWGKSLTRGAPIEVNLDIPVHIIRIPFVGRGVGPVVWIRARHVAHVEPYRSAE